MAGAKANFALRVQDKGWAELLKMARKPQAKYVKIGVLGKAKPREEKGGIQNVTLAVIHEFGAPERGIPARPFVRAAFNLKRLEYKEQLRKLVKGVYNLKMTIPRALGLMGVLIQGDMKKFLSQNKVKPPDSQATIDRKLKKGRERMGEVQGPLEDPKTLIDTGQLRNSISYQVVRK